MLDIEGLRDGLVGALEAVRDRLDSLASEIDTVADALPLGGDELSDDIADFIGEASAEVTSIIDGITAALDPDALADDELATLAAALDGIDGIEASVVDGDIAVRLAQTENRILGEQTIGALGGVIDLGDASLDIGADLGYDIGIVIDGDTGDLSLTTDDVDEFTFALMGDLRQIADISANLGFMSVILSLPDGAGGVDDPSELSFSVNANLDGLDGDFDVTTEGFAGLTFDFETEPSVLEDILPSIAGQFQAGFSYSAGTDGFGGFSGPSIAFSDVTVDAGSIAGVLDDVFGQLNGIVNTFPLGTLLDILNTTVPILDIKFAELLEGAAAATGRPIDLSFLDSINGIREITQALDDFSDGGEIALGDYNLGAGGEPENTPAGGGGAPAPAPTLAIGETGGLSIPLIDDPVGTVGALLFNNLSTNPVTLIDYDLAPLTFTQEVGQSFYIGPFFVNIGGLIGAALNFDIGYNTAGFTSGSVSFEDGFYIRTTSIEEAGLDDLALDPDFAPLAAVSLGVGASAGVGVGVVEVGIGGGVIGTIGVSLDANDDGLTYLSDLASFPCIFEEIAGGVDLDIFARIKIGFGPFSFTLRPTLAKIPLARFDIEAPCNLPPHLEVDNSGLGTTSETPNVLILNIGDRSGLRQLEAGLDVDEAGNDPAINEVFNIAFAPAEDDGTPADPNEVVVEAFTVFERYGDEEDGVRDNIDIVRGDAGAGDDVITLDANLTIAAELSGGADDDVLRGAQGDDTLLGGSGNDDLTGREGADTLRGGSGDDFLEGGAGADILDGEQGFDAVDYSNSTTAVSFTRDGANLIGAGGDAQGDTLISIERVTGSQFGDLLIGSAGTSSILDGIGGDDVLLGDTAADLLIGGLGRDFLAGGLQFSGGDIDRTSYAMSTGAVYIRFDPWTGSYVGSGGHAEGDRIYGIEGFQLSLRDDRFDGTGRAEEVEGFYGNDVINGRGGADTIFGGSGSDTIFANGSGALLSGDAPSGEVENENGDIETVFEAGQTTPVDRDLLDIGAGQTRNATVDLLPSGGPIFPGLPAPTLGTVTIAGLGTDYLERAPDREGSLTGFQRFPTFENVSGGQGNDSLSGDDANNTLDGRAGNDTLIGRGGDDILIGGLGGDSFEGGAGRDTLDYSGSNGAINVNLNLLNQPNSGGHAQNDRFRDDIEGIIGSQFRDTIIGNDEANDIDPGLFNGSGLEVIDGGMDIDRLILNYNDPRLNDFEFELALNSSGNGSAFADGSKVIDLTSIEELDIVTGDGDADIASSQSRDDVIITGAGNDRFSSLGGSDIVFTNAGDDWVRLVPSDTASLLETPSPSNSFFNIFGTQGRFLIADGGAGRDTLSVDLSDQRGSFFANGAAQDAPMGQIFVSDGRGTGIVETQGNAFIRNFEDFETIATNGGEDLLIQLGDTDNLFATGRDNDIIIPGLGADTISGGTNYIPGGEGGRFEEDIDTLVLNYRSVGNRVFLSYNVSDDYTVDSGAIFVVDSEDPITFPILLNAEDLRDNLKFYASDFGVEIVTETTFQDIERLIVEGTEFDDILFGVSNPRPSEEVEDVDSGTASQGYYAFDRRYTDGIRSSDIPIPEFSEFVGDYLNGGAGNDLIDGIDGDDTLIGGAGGDTIEGGLGDDVIIAGVRGALDAGVPGRLDRVDGGPGADLIVLGDETGLHYAEEAGRAEWIEITNFDTGEGDRLQLTGSAADYTLVEIDRIQTGTRIHKLEIYRSDRDQDDPGSLVAVLPFTSSFTRGFLDDFSLTDHVIYVDEVDAEPEPLDPDLTPDDASGLVGLLDKFRAGKITEAELLDRIEAAQNPGVLTASAVFSRDLGASTPTTTLSLTEDGAAHEQGADPQAPVVLNSFITALNGSSGPTLSSFDAIGPITVERSTISDVDGFLKDLIAEATGQTAAGLQTDVEGSSRAFGAFENAFGLSSGFVISTGEVADIPGTNLIDGDRITGPTSFSQNITLNFEKVADFGTEEVFRAVLPNVPGGLRSLTFSDTNGQGGGGSGAFTGFDFDAIALSTTRLDSGEIGSLADLNNLSVLPRIDAFDFSTDGVFYDPGAQTGGSSSRNLNGEVNGFVSQTLASLDRFDGFFSGRNAVTLGENGSIGFNLTQPIISTSANPVYVYISESGGTDEFVGSAVTVSTQEIGVSGDLSTDLGRPGAQDDRTGISAEFSLDLGDQSGDLFELFNIVIASEELIEFSGIDPEDLIEVRINGVNAAYLNNGAAATINNLAFSQSLDLPLGLGNAANDFGEDLILNLVGESSFNDITRADAFSRVLTVAAPLFTGVNTIEIAVADTRDAFLDTALFIAPFTEDTRVGDAFGTVPGGGASSNPDNAAPVAVSDFGIGFRTVKDIAFETVSVLSNDFDPDVGDALSIVDVDTRGTAGSVSHNGDGTFTYDPSAIADLIGEDEFALDSFRYTISDGNGGVSTAEVEIAVLGSSTIIVPTILPTDPADGDTDGDGKPDDPYLGTNGDDTIIPDETGEDGRPNDDIDGGPGTDIVIYRNPREEYTAERDPDDPAVIIITHNPPDGGEGDGRDRIEDVELIAFPDFGPTSIDSLFNKPPSDIILDGDEVEENAPGAAIGTLTVIDPNELDTITVTIDDDRFIVEGSLLRLRDGIALDYESQGPSIPIVVTATDQGGLFRTESFDIDILNRPETVKGEDAELRITSVNDWYDPRWGGGFNVRFEVSLTDRLITGETVTDWILDVDYLDPNAQITGGATNAYNAPVRFDPATGQFSTVNEGYKLTLEEGATISFFLQVQNAPFDPALLCLGFDDVDPDNPFEMGGPGHGGSGGNRPPEDLDLDNESVLAGKDGAVVGTITVTDPDDGDSFTFEIDDPRFTVDGFELKLKEGISLDITTDGPQLDLLLTVRDQNNASYSESFAIAVEDDAKTGPACFDLDDALVSVVSVDDWYDPRWGGGFNAVFELALTPDLIDGLMVSDWTLDVDFNHPDATFSTGWLNGFNASVHFDPATGVFSTLDKSYQLNLEAGDTIQFAVQVQGAGFDEDSFAFCFADLDPPLAIPTSGDDRNLSVDVAHTNFWGSGVVQDIRIENQDTMPVDAWAVKLDLDPGVFASIATQRSWRSESFTDGEDLYFVPKSYSASIDAGAEEDFGFNIAFTGRQDKLPWDDDDFEIVGIDEVPGFDPLTLGLDIV